MISLKIARWLLGYVQFSVIGGSPERFFNYCVRAGFVFWNMTASSNSSACVTCSRYRLLRPFARRAGCRLRVRQRCGLPFLLRRAHVHVGILYGAAAFIVILMVLSMHVWCIDVTGNTTIDSRDVLSALSENGLYPGARLSSIQTKMLEQKMMLMFPKIRWMTINTQGCTMQVCIQEKTERPEVKEETGICNVKASRTGQIVAIRVYAGTAKVKTGDAVAEGQLLVSGVVEDELGGSTLVHASAEIIAETTRSCKICVPLQQTVKEPTGSKVVRKSLQIFGANLPLTFIGKPKGEYDISGTQTDIRLFGTLLPISVYQEDWIGTRTVSVQISQQQAVEQAKAKLLDYEKSLPKGTKVLNVDASECVEKNTLIYNARLTCEEDIAVKSGISIK